MADPSPTATAGGKLAQGAGWVTAASFAVGLVNYVYALVLTAALSVEDYSVFAGGQALLLVAGSAASASIPWVLASGIATARSDPAARQSLVWFAIVSNAGLGVAAGVVVGLVASRFANPPITAILVMGTLFIFSASTAIGWLQGSERFKMIAAFKVVEVATKAGLGLALVAVGARAGGALAGFAVGAAVIALIGTLIMRADLSPSLSAVRARDLWSRAFAMGGIQTVVALLASAGAVAVVLLPNPPGDAASYQVAALLGRVPSFLAGALALVAFPLMSISDGALSADVTRRAIGAYVGISVPFALGMATIPESVLSAVFPTYDDVGKILPALATTGVLVGVIALLATSHQAAGRFRGVSQRLLVVFGLQAAGLALGWWIAGVQGMAAGELVGVAIGAAVVLRWRAGALALIPRIGYAQVATWMGLAILLFVSRGRTTGWLIAVATTGVAVLYWGFRQTQGEDG